MRRAPLVGLLAVATGLALAFLAEIEFLSAPPATRPPAIAAVTAPSAPGPYAAGADRLPALVATILARPLFEASRRPSEPLATAGAAGPSLPRLAGIIVDPAGRSAIFAGPTGGRSLVLAEGDKVGGYLIKSIAADAVVLMVRDGSRMVHPTFDPNAPTVPRVMVSAATIGPPAQLPSAQTPGRITLPGLAGKPP